MNQLLSRVSLFLKATGRRHSFFGRMVAASLVPVLAVGIGLIVLSVKTQETDARTSLELRGEQVATTIADAILLDAMVGNQDHWFKAFHSISSSDSTIKRISIVGPSGETILGYGEHPQPTDVVVVERPIKADGDRPTLGSIRVELSVRPMAMAHLPNRFGSPLPY